jgi:hypothetical protein
MSRSSPPSIPAAAAVAAAAVEEESTRSNFSSMSVPFRTVGMCIGATFVLLAPMYSAKSVDKNKVTNTIVVAEEVRRKGG